MSIIAVTMKSPDLDGEVELRFGRAPHILLVDPDTMEWESTFNPAWGASGGAGVQAAQLLAGRRAEAVVSGDFGPNAQEALAAAGIEMYRCREGMTGRQAIEWVRDGETGSPADPTASGTEAAAGSRPAARPSGKPDTRISEALGSVVGGLVAGRLWEGGRGDRGGRGQGGGGGRGRGGGQGRGLGPGGGRGRGGGQGRGRGLGPGGGEGRGGGRGAGR